MRERFQALASLAGNFLLSPGTAGKVSRETLTEADAVVRWLMAVRQLTNRFETGPSGVLQDESGVAVGTLLSAKCAVHNSTVAPRATSEPVAGKSGGVDFTDRLTIEGGAYGKTRGVRRGRSE